jgi:D-alanyl-D-alanine carboxypeptidase (penicillin-binding protein 5/6)
MPFRFYFLLFFFTVALLFYPGNSPLFRLFAFNKDLFIQQVTKDTPKIHPIPHLKYNSAPPISAGGAYIVDLNSFTPVYARNEHVQFNPASTTKMVTALVVEDLWDNDEVLTIKHAFNEGQVMGLVPGERITVENLLYGMLVYSGNDAAYDFADIYGYDDFMALMNKKAKDIGMRNTQFKNPNGLDAAGHYSSPYDLAVAGREVLKSKELRKIVSIKSITVSDIDFKYFHKLNKVNELLGEVQGVGGLKTGYTESAGQNLVSFYKWSDDKEFIIVVLKSEDRFEDTRLIIDWLRNNVEYTPVSI